ncbi:MAG: PQQ-dependent sugar dehydrogenase [Jatrophihabitantaceae bacterium]
MRPPARTGAAVAVVLLLTGCGSTSAAVPDWRPQPSFVGEGHLPNIQLPIPGQSGPNGPPSDQGGPMPSGQTPSPSKSNAQDPAVLATKLTTPTALVLLPDGSALVGERTTGRLLRVQPMPDKAVPVVRTIAGLSTVGSGGLLDLALSPHYSQDGLIFAYLTTATDNRVVAFTLTGPITPVFTGIPRGASGNGGRIAFGADGLLYVGTGTAGDPGAASEPTSLAGKVLRLTDIGGPAPGNPNPSSPIFATGAAAVTGLCLDTKSGALITVGAASDSQVKQVLAGAVTPIASLPVKQGGPGGCAVMNSVLYISSLDGKDLVSTPLTVKSGALNVGTFAPLLPNKYGRLLTVVAAPDGALWLTTSNRDGKGAPVPTDERVIRIVPSGGGADNGSV